jgi:hypothetical protein
MTTFETVADQLVRDLVRMEVRRIYGLAGDSLHSISAPVLVGLGQISAGRIWATVLHRVRGSAGARLERGGPVFTFRYPGFSRAVDTAKTYQRPDEFRQCGTGGFGVVTVPSEAAYMDLT